MFKKLWKISMNMTKIIDFQQAYESIIKDQLWSVLILFGILVNLIKCCKSSTICLMRFLGETSKKFEVRCGLKQGDTLSPALFNLALEKVIIETCRKRNGSTGAHNSLSICV